MFPPQTSLIPVSVSLARFIADHGLAAFGEVYPYWYLGIPFRYVASPIVHPLLALLTRVGVDQYVAAYSVIICSFIVSWIGWGLLTYVISHRKKLALLLIVIQPLFLWRSVSALALSDVPITLARNILPLVFIIYYILCRKRERSIVLVALASVISGTIILIDITIIPNLVIGALSCALAASFSKKKGKFVHLIRRLRLPALSIVIGWLVATIWYTPSYWLTVLINPSIGGVSGLGALGRVVELARAILPVFFGVAAVMFLHKLPKSRIFVFGIAYLLPFLFLVLFRFASDSDFWQDWTTWLFEVETAVVILWAYFWYTGYKKTVVIGAMIALWVVDIAVVNSLRVPLINPQATYPEPVLSQVAARVGTERVFLSGSSVFWANTYHYINQLRGGVDRVATNPYWGHAAYQFRVGESASLSRAWAQLLGIRYVLVSSNTSKDYYHDFNNTLKWKDVGSVVWESDGDFLYDLGQTPLAWEVRLSHCPRPQGGSDQSALECLLARRVKPLTSHQIGSQLYVEGAPMINLAYTFSPHISAYGAESKRQLVVSKDTLGDILIHSSASEGIIVTF